MSFASSFLNIQHMKVKHENVLFTDKMKYLKQFANNDLLQNEIIKFIKALEKKSRVKFNINSETLLKFNTINKFK